MTIVAGFKCKNGVVIFADTEHTAGSTKFNAPKMWTDENRSMIATAGTDDYTKNAIDDLSDKFNSRKMKWTSEGVRQAVKDVLTDVHHRIRGAYGIDNRPQVSLMTAIRLDDWTTILIKGVDTAVALIDELDFIGAGHEIARFVISPFYNANLRVAEMGVIGGYCFRFAKASGIYAGGDTYVGTLYDGNADAKYAHPAFMKRDPQVVTDHILGQFAPALSAAWNSEVSPDEFEKRLEALMQWLRLQRKRQEDAGKK